MYFHLTPEEKRRQAKLRRDAKRGKLAQMSRELLDPLVFSTLDRLERSFEALAKDNIPDHLIIKRSELELTIEVKGTGPYRMFVDDQLGVFCMQSPESGLFHYEWQEADKRWFSMQQVHILDELLCREFIMHSRGLLDV